MDGKLYDLVEKMYADMQDMKSNMATKEDLAKVEKRLRHDIVRLENKMDDNHKALYDGYKLSYEKLTTLENKVDKIDKKVERHDVVVKAIQEVRS